LTGTDGFYDDLFESMGVPYEPVRWRVDNNATDGTEEGEHLRLVKQVHVGTLINMYRVRGHLIAHLDPLDAEPPHIHPELDPLTYGLTIWDLPRQFVTDGLAGRDVATLDEILHVLRDAYCRTLGIEYMHIQDPEQKRWIQQHVEGQPATLNLEEQRHILDRLNAAEVFERFLHTRYVGQKRFGLEGAESAIVLLDALLDDVGRAGLPVELHVEGEPFPLPQAIDVSAYRIVQEGLTNALKHAHASRADVTVRYRSDELQIEVRDDGGGSSRSDGLGHGLVGVRERVKIYGGDMTAGPADGRGYVLSTRLPLGRET